MSQYQKSYSVQINEQLNFVLALTNDLKRKVLKTSVMNLLFPGPKKVRASICQTFLKDPIISSENQPSWQFIINSDDDVEIDSFGHQHNQNIELGRKSFVQIVGLSQFDETYHESQISQIQFQKSQKDLKDLSYKSLALVRGPYRSYQTQEKLKVIRLYKEGRNYAFISRFMQIPQKNIVRWCKNGVNRKQGAGRKIGDAQMQRKVLRWIGNVYNEGNGIKSKQIRQKAMEFSTKQEFKSSKGWLKNFIRRYNLNQKYDIL